MWRPSAGSFPLIRPANEKGTVRGLGTDGKHMVWTSTEQDGSYVMVSKFTTDPAALRARRLVAFPSDEPAIVPWTVGCGHAAYNPKRGVVLIVRLADGLLRTLRSSCAPGEWCFSTVYALTCNEVFLRADGKHMNVARVRFEELPSDTPQ